MKKILITIGILLLAPVIAGAVGIGLLTYKPIELGQIKINKTYDLGSMNFCNTGDEAGWFELRVINVVSNKKPVPQEWIKYDETKFYLEPYRCAIAYGELTVQPKYALEKPIAGEYQAVIAGCVGEGGIGVCAGRYLRFNIGKQ